MLGLVFNEATFIPGVNIRRLNNGNASIPMPGFGPNVYIGCELLPPWLLDALFS